MDYYVHLYSYVLCVSPCYLQTLYISPCHSWKACSFQSVYFTVGHNCQTCTTSYKQLEIVSELYQASTTCNSDLILQQFLRVITFSSPNANYSRYEDMLSIIFVLYYEK